MAENSGQGCINLLTDGLFKHRFYVPVLTNSDIQPGTNLTVDLTAAGYGTNGVNLFLGNQKVSEYRYNSNTNNMYNSKKNLDYKNNQIPKPFYVAADSGYAIDDVWAEFTDECINTLYDKCNRDIYKYLVSLLDRPEDSTFVGNVSDTIQATSVVMSDGSATGDVLHWEVRWIRDNAQTSYTHWYDGSLEEGYGYTQAEYDDLKPQYKYTPEIKLYVNDNIDNLLNQGFGLFRYEDAQGNIITELRDIRFDVKFSNDMPNWTKLYPNNGVSVGTTEPYIFTKTSGRNKALEELGLYYITNTEDIVPSSKVDMLRIAMNYIEAPVAYVDNSPHGEDDFDDTEGTGDFTSESQQMTVVPSLQNATSGFINVYRISSLNMNQLGGYMWSTNFHDNLIKITNSPFDLILACHVVPCTPSILGSEDIKLGNLSATGVSGDICTSDIVEIDCGNFEWQGAYGLFPDYLAEVKVYLPFIGWQSLNASEIISTNKLHRIMNLRYRINIVTGECLAWIDLVEGGLLHKIVMQASGNCRNPMIISQAQYNAISTISLTGNISQEQMFRENLAREALNVGGGVAGAVGAGIGLATGGPAGMFIGSQVGNMAAGSLSNLANSTSSKGHYQTSGIMQGSIGYMNLRQPMLKIVYGDYTAPDNFAEVVGYRSNYGGVIGDFTGYGEFDNIKLDMVTMNDWERKELFNHLKNGVYNDYIAITNPTTYKMSFYTNHSDDRCIYKDITYNSGIDGSFRKTQNTDRIIVDIEASYSTLASSNYVYVKDLGKWYFIRERSVINSSLTQLVLVCDTLMTYRDQLQSCQCICKRSATKYNRLMVDDKITHLIDDQYVYKKFGNEFLTENYILITLGA